MKQINHWFYNRTGKSRGTKATVNINLNEAAPRNRTEIQVYSRMFYASHVKAIVDPQLIDVPQNEKIAVRARLTAEMYAKEDDDIKAAVREELQKDIERNKEGRAALEKLVGAPGEMLNPNEIAK